jgi:plasmid replication initiation protein
LPQRYPQTELFICDGLDAIPKDDMASMEHPLFSLATKPDKRIVAYEHNGNRIEIIPSVKGLATIHDKDILIYCISQLIAGMNEGRAPSPVLHLTARDLLMWTNRQTDGDGYERLRNAF